MLLNYSFKKIATILFLLLISCYNSQTYTIAELNKLSNEYVYNGKVGDAIKINYEALDEFKSKNDTKGIATAYINIAGSLWNMTQYKEALHYLDKAKEVISTKKDTQLEAKLYSEYGRNYNSLELYTHSNLQLNKALGYVKNLPEEHKGIYKYHIYFRKWQNFESLEQKDSAYAMKNKALKIFPTSELYLSISEQYINKKNFDSANIYIKKALLEEDINILYNKSLLFKIYEG